jgi:hypothetical protein
MKFENENFVWIFESESYFTVSFIQNICKKLQKWNVNSFDDILQSRVGLLLCFVPKKFLNVSMKVWNLLGKCGNEETVTLHV